MYFIFILTLITSNCSFNLQRIPPTQLNYILIKTNNPNSIFIHTFFHQLRDVYNIQILENIDKKSINIPILSLENEIYDKYTNSVFLNGKEATYRLVMSIKVNILLPDKPTYCTTIKATRFFFNNLNITLIKDLEMEIILQEMRQNLVNQLIEKLFCIYKYDK